MEHPMLWMIEGLEGRTLLSRAVQLPFDTPPTLPARIQVEDFDRGAPAVAYNDSTAGNRGKSYRSGNADIYPAYDTGGGYCVARTTAGEWLEYTINVPRTGQYDLSVRVASSGPGGTFHIRVDGVRKTESLAVPDTGGPQTWQTITRPGVNLAAGTHVLKIVIDSVGPAGTAGNFNWIQLGAMPDATPAEYSGPIVITRGGTYSGMWQSLNPTVPAISIQTDQPVTIIDSVIRSRGRLIEAKDSAVNLTVRNTSGYALNPNVYGKAPGRFLFIKKFVNIDVENCYMEGTGGIYLENYQGDGSASQTVKVLRNQAKNIDGRWSDGNGGYLSAVNLWSVANFFQINGGHDLARAEVAWNQVINDPGRSRPEDVINIFDSGGTAASPFAIHDNYIQGAYNADPANDTDYSGGGIMMDLSADYVNVYRNQIISTTNYGIAIAGGHDNAMYNNRVVSSGLLADGRDIAAQNVGAYIWNSYAEGDFANNSGWGNIIGWNQYGARNDEWVEEATSWDNNRAWPGDITLATEAAEYARWTNKLASNGVSVGVS